MILLLISLALSAASLVPIAYGALKREYYPVSVPPDYGAGYFLAVGAYTALALLPLIYAGKEALTWHSLRSEI